VGLGRWLDTSSGWYTVVVLGAAGRVSWYSTESSGKFQTLALDASIVSPHSVIDHAQKLPVCLGFARSKTSIVQVPTGSSPQCFSDMKPQPTKPVRASS
jgi:hypothetical protein